MVGAFPQYPPYGGAFDEVVPHLSVGEARHASPERLREVEAAVVSRLPAWSWADRGLLIAGSDSPGSWHLVAELSFGG